VRFTVDCNSWYRGCLEIINFLFVHLPSWIGSSRSVRLQLSLVFLSISGLEPVVWRLGLVWLGGHFWIVYWRDNQPLSGVLCPYPWSVSNDCALNINLNPFPTCHVLCTVLHLGDLGLLFARQVSFCFQFLIFLSRFLSFSRQRYLISISLPYLWSTYLHAPLQVSPLLPFWTSQSVIGKQNPVMWILWRTATQQVQGNYFFLFSYLDSEILSS
jgi:hypothetical protein